MGAAGKRSPLEAAQEPPSETSPLLPPSLSGEDTPPTSERDIEASAADPSSDAFIESVQSQSQLAAWTTEAKVLASSSSSMALTFFLQYSINFMSIFAAGRIGKLELGAAALANMTAAVTCLAPFIGFTTSLDTLCSQAYGDGRKHLVGLHCQRMVLMLFCLAVPVALFWWYSQPVFEIMIPNPRSAALAAQYMRVLVWSIPGTIIYEAGKRLLQAQGLFRETTYVLFIVAPLNAIANYAFVFYFDLGFIGAPMAVCLSRNLLALCLVLYVKYVNGYQCWGGFSSRAFNNWGPMIWLALPGMIMVLAEWGAFELMTFLAARFGDDYLAAQSTLVTSSGISFQVPFAMSVASSTRIANLIGAGLVDRARIAAKVTAFAFVLVGAIICVLYVSLRYYIPLMFTDDETVVSLVAVVMPIVASMQVFDAFATAANGVLRGLGKQAIGGPANIFGYYFVGFPIALLLINKAGWKLEALWTGVGIGITLIAFMEIGYILWTDWDKASEEARKRNMAN